MASSRALDTRWIRRYRCFCVAGCVILIIQVFLAYVFLNISSEVEKHAQEYHLSGKGKLNFEVLDDRQSVESSRRFRDSYLLLDDEEDEGPGNSNSVYNRVKVPPDKTDSGGQMQPSKPKHDARELIPKTKLQVNKTTVLRVEELDFVPLCEITGKEAISAIHRAKTQHCKQLLANVTCLIQHQQLYPTQLKHSCPAAGYEAGRSLGCFQDEKKFRLLSGYYANLKTTNSPQHCINLCLQSGFPYAGVQFVTECFCGNEEPASTSRLPDSSCNMKCPEDPRQACGGYYTINVYETGIAKLTPQPPNEAETISTSSGVRIVFLLTLNGRAVRQVKRLLKALYHRDHYFFIHVDARQDYMFRELLPLEHLSNVRLCRERHATIWGGASLLTMLLQAMAELEKSDWNWDFLINLSESDFPIKSNVQLVEFLSSNRNRNFVKSHGREVQRFIQKQGLDKTFVECEAHMWRAGDRVLPWGIAMDGGSDWVALSRPFVTFLANWRNDSLLSGLVTVFKYTLLPAESFFHTALRNSKFCKTYTDNNLHVTNWKRRLGCKCQYKHIVDWCGCSPNNFKPEDWPRIQATETRPLFFARKFEPIINQAVLLQLEEWLYGPYPLNITNKESYWQSVYHHHDISPPFDDTLGTVATSLIRLTTKLMSNLDSECSLIPGKLIEVTSYMFNDFYKGSLIQYEAQIKGKSEKIILESWVRPDEHFSIVNAVGPSVRFKLMIVSSVFDQKEQVHRNLLRSMSVFSEPSLACHVNSGAGTYNITFLWLDPTGVLADVTEAYFDETASVQYIKPVLKLPLLPGVWEVKVVWNNTIVARVDFLICPMQFASGAELMSQQAGFLHGGSGQPYRAASITEWSSLLRISEQTTSALHRKALLNAMRFGRDLLQWIDSLTSRFYRVIETCVDDNTELQFCRPVTLEPCRGTAWSSFAPDPKSYLPLDDPSPVVLRRW
ncbi:xylosyltransferase oxt isoform X2 [Lycorma delicatula]|uniref:xylosyltransferase oxt isoform X2 n=1 Tax=Lycorma delicatula TaxID=130591 RepID=UPI003F50EC73